MSVLKMANLASNLLLLIFLSLVCSLSNADSLQKRVLEAPLELDNGWEYQGCYVDVPGRTINKVVTGNAQMTNEICGKFCFEKGYAYAGTEYYDECFCGNKLAVGGVEVQKSDCNTPCKGAVSQPCGGPDRLTMYKRDVAAGPKENPGIKDWPSIGCYAEGTTGRALTFELHSVPASEMTVARCIAGCEEHGFELAGVEFSAECFCGNTISSGGKPAKDECDMVCSGNSTEFCGGPNRLNVYDYKLRYSGDLTTTAASASSTSPVSNEAATITSGSAASTSSTQSATASTPLTASTSESFTSSGSAPTPSASTPATSLFSGSRTIMAVPSTTSSLGGSFETQCPYQPPSVGQWDYYGCYTEATGQRALSGRTTASNDMTIAKCASFCVGFEYFGLEYAWECFCGNSFNTGSVKTDNSQCNMICGGSECNYCGAGNRLSVYTIGDPPPENSVTEVEPSLVEPSTISKAPTPTGLPSGWGYYGCWVDAAQGRILNYQAPDNAQLTIQSCVKTCADKGYTVAGAEYFTQCFCGKALINGAVKAQSESQCSTPCGGNSAQNCGGPARMSIYSIGAPSVFGPPAPVPSVGDWKYKGCAVDNVNDKRTFPWQLFFPGTLTPKACFDKCGEFGYAAAGLEYGVECYCGDPANMATSGSTFVAESTCNIPCAGNDTAICGGPARLSTYFWEGDPFYSWDIPAAGSPAAGAYNHLIGGVVIPLMTSETILGKVTFLEKWTTGPPNSTGAYELDLSQVSNSNAAWRTMHVKTDLFCAAGVTLPDKAGRQLTVGGWSGDSTYGVRLYTPDGGPGVKGTNDWEENVDVLSLQVGRWYPSTMNMANGSILVVGGEEGSNAAPVPSLEILPLTGTKPLYMEWLERTDPNNLYPFLAVLPSGGIFVAYWNEARILDEKTFATIRTLPNIPGAVNDPMGGRTYPLEGTSVLLPQRAPYSAPLEVLICGGSTIGIANALDNCVSIEPDTPNAKWVIERMPSKRVISCMAPLPDGTYWIGNGAKAGVAGFGLANTPNLNAVLYNPSKPKGSRMTVMANTTVARMYHSEAITLLDGRVLISGSDPQDGVNPQEYRVETFSPPYLLSGKPRPTFQLANKDWVYGSSATFTLGNAPRNGQISVSLLGSVSSTHGNSMGARTLFPAVSCNGLTCTVTVPPRAHIAPPGWYQFFVLDGGIPAVGVYVRIGGDPAKIGNWPDAEGFTRPGI